MIQDTFDLACRSLDEKYMGERGNRRVDASCDASLSRLSVKENLRQRPVPYKEWGPFLSARDEGADAVEGQSKVLKSK